MTNLFPCHEPQCCSLLSLDELEDVRWAAVAVLVRLVLIAWIIVSDVCRAQLTSSASRTSHGRCAPMQEAIQVLEERRIKQQRSLIIKESSSDGGGYEPSHVDGCHGRAKEGNEPDPRNGISRNSGLLV